MSDYGDNALLGEVLDILERLVGCDTQNPPRDIARDGVFAVVEEHLGGFDVDVFDYGDGCLALHAVRGKPDVLFNVHLDTVPVAEGWTDDPFELKVTGKRAVGLGACDIKGAAACLLAAAERTAGDLALLFTSDEEAGSSRCVRKFTSADWPYDTVVVAEPTGARAVLAHRGIVTCSAEFDGQPGHASERRALQESAVHRMMRWALRALELAEAHEQTAYRGLSGIRFNIGRVEGGVKPNMIASSARIRFGFRPLPDQNADDLLGELQSFADDNVRWERGFHGPTLPADGPSGDPAGDARAFATRADLEVGAPVDFWTEASLFSQAGFTALVYGPGDIARAHTADEWVALDQLRRAVGTYVRLVTEGVT